MGFWSSIGSAISGAFSSVCSAVSSACSAVGKAVSDTFSGAMENIGKIPAVVATLAPVLQVLSVVFPQLRPLSVVVQTLDTIFQALGLAEEGQTTEDVGQDVLDAYNADIKPTDYDTYDEYKEAIRNFKLDNPEYEKGEYTFAEKFASGLTIQSWGLAEKFGEDSLGLVVSVLNDAPNLEKGEGYFTPERMEGWLKNVTTIADVAKYFSGKLSVDESNKVEQELVKAEQQLDPEKSVETIYQELDEHRNDN